MRFGRVADLGVRGPFVVRRPSELSQAEADFAPDTFTRISGGGARGTEPPERSLVGDLFKSGVIASIYSSLTEHPMWADQNRALARHFGPDAPDKPKVLELGAGTGIGTFALRDELGPGAELIGIDFSAPMIARAEARRQSSGAKNVQFRQADATHLDDMADDSCDFVVANSFLYLVPDPVAVLREARRVLAPGGRLVFMEPREEGSLFTAGVAALQNVKNLVRQPASALRLVASMLAWRAMSGLEGRRNEAELSALFEKAGFDEVRFEPTLGGLGQHIIAT